MTAQPLSNCKIDYNLYYVQPDSIDLYWNEVDFSKIESHLYMTDQDLKDLIRKGNLDFFIVHGSNLETYGGFLLRVYDGYGGRVMEVIGVSGFDMFEWLDKAVEQIEMVAKKAQCQRVVINGRKGWKKVLSGFKEISTTIEKTLW